MAFTNGKGALGRIYDRLRKRSYRALQRRHAEYDPWERGIDPTLEHDYYVAGVRDALAAVEEATIGEIIVGETSADLRLAKVL